MTKKEISDEMSDLLGFNVTEGKLTDEMCANYLFDKKDSEDYFMNDPELSAEDKHNSVQDCLMMFCQNNISPLFNQKVNPQSISSDASGNMILDIGMMFGDNSGTVTLKPNRSNCSHNFQKYEFGSYVGHQKCVYCKKVK